MATAPLPVVRSARALWRAAEFGTVVLGPDAIEPLTLTGTGTAVWDALDEPRTPAALAAMLAVRFHAEPSVVAADIEPVLAELVAIGAVTEIGELGVGGSGNHRPVAG